MRGDAMTHVAHHGPRAAQRRPAIRYLLGSLLAFGALCAFGGGYYGLAGAKDVPREWLEGTPFKDYFFPSLILFVVVGGSCLIAAAAVLARLQIGRVAAFGAAAVLLIWLAVESLMLGYVSWMQPTTTAGALVVLLLAWFLPGRMPRRSDWHERASGYAWFAAMVGGWLAFYTLMVTHEATLGDLFAWIRELPMLAELVLWLAFFPFVLALTIWNGGWAEVVRFALVTACALAWSLMFYPRRKVPPLGAQELSHD
jgi:hypothetical protein